VCVCGVCGVCGVTCVCVCGVCACVCVCVCACVWGKLKETGSLGSLSWTNTTTLVHRGARNTPSFISTHFIHQENGCCRVWRHLVEVSDCNHLKLPPPPTIANVKKSVWFVLPGLLWKYVRLCEVFIDHTDHKDS